MTATGSGSAFASHPEFIYWAQDDLLLEIQMQRHLEYVVVRFGTSSPGGWDKGERAKGHSR